MLGQSYELLHTFRNRKTFKSFKENLEILYLNPCPSVFSSLMYVSPN
jgi:hypothetical protein